MSRNAAVRIATTSGRPVPVSVHAGDIPAEVAEAAERVGRVGWDTETTGLEWRSARLATCQLFIDGFGAHVVRLGESAPTRLSMLLQQRSVQKVFHHAPFDLRFMSYGWKCLPANVVCTKIASKVLEPDRADHSLKTLLQDHLGVEISKAERMSNWQADELSPEQVAYAASDVAYLTLLFDHLRAKLEASERWWAAARCFEFLPVQVQLELWGSPKVFEY
jgi:ribonuclease D